MRNQKKITKKVKVECAVCKKEQEVIPARAKKYKTCSLKCMGEYFKSKNFNCECSNCGINFHMKESRKTSHSRKYGYFCTVECFSKWRSNNLKSEKNPNFRNKMYDQDGYRIVHSEKIGRQKLHHVITYEILEIDHIPKGYHVHHRDCDHLNNISENLVLLSTSDHIWLHKQYGSATLWAFMNNKIDLNSLVEWSNDKEKAIKLLSLNIHIQKLDIEFLNKIRKNEN